MKTIDLKSFSNKMAFDIGLKIISIAEVQEKNIAVEIRRLNQQVFLFIAEGLSEDKNNWLFRKANTALRFNQSSKSVFEKLEKEGSNLYDKYGLSREKYVAVAGAIPLLLSSGIVAVVSVTGLSPDEDHQMILDAIEMMRKEGYDGL